MLPEAQTIVIDVGSGICKAGFAGEEAPRVTFPSVIGYSKYMRIGGRNDIYVGDEACAKTGVLNLKYPISNGIVTNWNDMDRIWHQMFYYKLRVDPSEYSVFLTEPLNNPKENRENMIQHMFETFNVTGLCCMSQPILALFSTGRVTGVALDVGDSLCQIAPVYDGYAIEEQSDKIHFGGRNVTYKLKKLLEARHYTFNRLDQLNNMKEKVGYVAYDYDSSLLAAGQSAVCEVSGKMITVDEERFRCTEILFQPQLYGDECEGISDGGYNTPNRGIHQAVFDSIKNCDSDICSNLYANIVLSGGTTLFSGFPERIKKEITALSTTICSTKVEVIAEPNRMYGAWIGGSVIASLPTFPQMLVTRDEYNDAGTDIVHRKFPTIDLNLVPK